MVQKRRVSSDETEPPLQKQLKVSKDAVDSCEPFAMLQMLWNVDKGKYGSATADIEALIARKQQCLLSLMTDRKASAVCEVKQENEIFPSRGLGDLVGILPVAAAPPQIVIIDSDEEDDRDMTASTYPFEGIFLPKPVEPVAMGTPLPLNTPFTLGNEVDHRRRSTQGEVSLNEDTAEVERDKGEYIGVEEEDDESEEEDDDGLGDVWKEMDLAIEHSKVGAEDSPSGDGSEDEEEEGEDKCDHSFVLKDDIGYVCRVCGVIGKGIESIVEIQFNKGKRSMRTYFADNQRGKDKDSFDMSGIKLSAEDLEVTEIAAHPRHQKQMKPHQVEGFNFLVGNLISDNPGGCILAHAPGSGKTFMIISFMQSFLAKYPRARPLVILPKGILSTWRKEFQRWQVEDIPLLDFYTRKAEKRVQQLEVLKQWVDQRSILFLGYKQFSTIVCEAATNEVSASCQEILLKVPAILILDEGHTPRNENTDVLQSLAKVQTPRKVVLSGTLYQNHVKEVFNIVNLVRPKFLKLENSRVVMRRIMSTVDISGVRKQFKGSTEAAFYEVVEHTLQKDMDLDRKVALIKNLREMTHKILHYYKGDFLDELPGLVDYTVVLNLSGHQKRDLKKLKTTTERKFTVSARGSALYLHPLLDDNTARGDAEMDELLDKIDIKQGVKAKFFLNMLSLSECSGEKLLVFSQYLTPLKFMERLAAKARGWSLNKEIFVISGETNADDREVAMDHFNNSPDSRVFFGSIKACGEGISLVGASRIIILDVPLNPSVTRQAIGRAFRPGQTKKVFAYRLVAAESPEENDHTMCFEKEKISKMWFEWNEHCGSSGQFEIDPVDMRDCGDDFLDNPAMREDVKALYKR